MTLKVITQNQEEFIRILNEPDASDAAPAATPAAGGGAGGPAISRDQVYFCLIAFELCAQDSKLEGGYLFKLFQF